MTLVAVIVNLMVVLPSPSPLLTSCPGEGRVGAEPGLCRLHLHRRLGVSGLYTDHMERRKYSTPASLSPPMIPSPPPPVNTSTLTRKHPFHAEKQGLASGGGWVPPPTLQCNGQMSNINMVDFKTPDKKSAIEASNDLTRRIAELGQDRSVEPTDTLGHLQIKDLPELNAFPQISANSNFFNSRNHNSPGYM